MMNIRPVSDLRNKFPEIERLVIDNGQPVFLTKNGCGSMVVMSLEQYSQLTDDIELKLKEADDAAVLNETRFTGESVFKRARERVNE